MGYSMRDFIEELKKRGELAEIDEEIDWNYEANCFAMMAMRVDGPALLFNKLKGIEEGRLLVGHFRGSPTNPHRRISMSIGIDPELDWLDQSAEMMRRMVTPLKPVEVATGPVKEVIKMGADVNLMELPFPYLCIGDGGRYLLQQCVICKDPDSDWVNWGNYACMIPARNRITICAGPATNTYEIYTYKYEARGNSMPVAIAVGMDPAVYLLAGTMMPPGVSEADIAGGLRGSPMELIKCETSSLLVPADAEIVFEGEIRPYERLMEGPKPEAYGFSVGPRTPAPAMRVHCITFRKNPIIPFVTLSGYGMSELSSIILTMFVPSMNTVAITTGMPAKIGMMTVFPWGGFAFPFSTKDYYPGYVHDCADKGLAMGPIAAYADRLEFVDDDVNILRSERLIDALYTQINPARDMWRTDHTSAALVTVRSYWEREDLERDLGGEYGVLSAITGLWVRDALTKGEPPLGVRRTCFETLFPEELQKWVMDNRQRLGFKEEPYWNKRYLDMKPSLI